MALVGSYSVTGKESTTYTYQYDSVDDLLEKLLDNNDNEIDPVDIRDPVLSLWRKVENIELVAASAASASSFFANPLPTTQAVGGIAQGTSFPVPTDMQTMWNLLLYPYRAPVLSLSVAGGVTTREFGNPLGLSPNSITLNYNISISSTQYSISSVTVAGIPKGTAPSGSQTVTGTHSIGQLSSIQTFNMSASDTYPTTVSTSTSITWTNKIYWGSINLSSVDLTSNPGSASWVASVCTDLAIRSLIGAGVNPGSDLSTTKNRTYTNINGGGKHLIFAWPSLVSGATTPTFNVNGLPNSAFTRVRTASPFTNDHGYTANYEVWVSNTAQNSPLTIIIS